MRNQPIPLVTGFYRDQDRPYSQQDVWNYMPCKAEHAGARSPLMLKTPPGLFPWLEIEDAPPVRGIHDVEGRLFAVIGSMLYRLSVTGVAIPIGTIPGNGRVQMDHNQISGGNQLMVTNGSAGYVYDTVDQSFERVTDTGYPGSYLVRFMDGYLIGIDPSGRFAFNSDPADAKSYNTLNRWTSEYRPDRLVSMARVGGDLLLLSAGSGEFFANSGQYPQPFQSKRIFLDKGCAGPFTVAEADSTAFWLGSDGFFYQLDGYGALRISTRPVEQAIRGLDWWNAFAFVWESEGHTCVGWTFLDGQTWLWDCSQREWHRRESYGLDRWRVNCTAKSNGQWYAGDFQKGRVWRIDWGYPWEGDTEFVSGFTQPVIHDNQNELIHSRLEIVMDTGQPEVTPSAFPEQPVGPTITGDAPNGTVGVAYAGYTYTVTPGDAPIASVTITRGTIPAGLTFDPSGEVEAGTPTATGVYTFTIRVVDTNGLWAELTDSISIAMVLLVGGFISDTQVGIVAVPDVTNWTETPVSPPAEIGGVSGMTGIGSRGLLWDTTYIAKTDTYGAGWALTSAALGGSGGPRGSAYRDGLLLIGGGSFAMRMSTDVGETTTEISSPQSNYMAWCGERLLSISQYSLKIHYSDSTVAEFIAGDQSFSEGASHGLDITNLGSVASLNACCMFGGKDTGGKPKLCITTDGESVELVVFDDAEDGPVTAIIAAEVDGSEIWACGTGAGEIYWSDDRFATRHKASVSHTEAILAGGHNGAYFVFVGGPYDSAAFYAADGKNYNQVPSIPMEQGLYAMAIVQ